MTINKHEFSVMERIRFRCAGRARIGGDFDPNEAWDRLERLNAPTHEGTKVGVPSLEGLRGRRAIFSGGAKTNSPAES